MIKRRKFVTYDEKGAIKKMYCKVCGEPIAGTEMRPKGSGPDITVMVPKFMRYANYAEAKFYFNDGSHHVTNGCRNCLTNALTPQQMHTLYRVDMEEMGMFAGTRRPLVVVTVDYSCQGIL